MMKKIYCCCLLFCLAILFSSQSAASLIPQHTHFLAVSDIHFDPYYSCEDRTLSCPILDLLEEKPISEWEQIFKSLDQLPSQYGKDTGYKLFKASLDKFNSLIIKNKIAFVIVGGDLIVHDSQKLYLKYRPGATTEDYEHFAIKLFSYITLAIKKSVSPVDTYMVVGNNDTFGEHYTSSPKFYKIIGPIWSGLIQNKNGCERMEREFIKAGYYSIFEKNNLRLIILNSTFFSPNAALQDHTALLQLDWLQENLRDAVIKKQKILIITHIPAGIDVYDTINTNRLSLLWRREFLTRLYSLLKEFNDSIIAILTAHLHADWMQALNLGKGDLLISSIPAISPQFGNNPGFKVFDLNHNTQQLDDYTVYYYPINKISLTWDVEYRFSNIYPAKHLLDGANLIKKSGLYADKYKKFFSIMTDSQPITKNKWMPYYWCAIHNVLPRGYLKCIRD